MFTPDGSALLSLGKGSSRLWRLPSPDKPHLQRVLANSWWVKPRVAFTADGKLVAVALFNTIRIKQWPADKTVGHVPLLGPQLREVRNLLISQTTVIADGWGLESGRRTVVARLPAGEPVAALSWPDPQSPSLITPDGQYFAVVEPEGLGLWRLPACTRIETTRRPPAYEISNSHAGITQDSRLLVRSGKRHTELFDIPSGHRRQGIVLSDARLLPTPDGALLVGFDAEGELEVRRYRPSPLAALAERPLRELTGAETEAFHHQYGDPADTALANLGAALLSYVRRDRPRGL